PAGAAVAELADPLLESLVQDVAGALDVDLPVVGVRHVHLAERGGQMVHHLDPLHGPADHRRVGDAAEDDPRPPIPQLSRLQPFLIVQGHHLVPKVEQAPHQRLAGEARTPGDQNSHDSTLSSRCTLKMTGDPSARVSPRKTLARSIAREAPARPSFRWTTIGTKNWRRVSGSPKPCR